MRGAWWQPLLRLKRTLRMTTTRIIGFDLARAWAIFGMYIVNFNTVFGSHKVTTGLGGFLNLFNGNSSSAFVMLAGMGVALMTNRPAYKAAEQRQLRQKVVRRSWFLFALGLVLYAWWPADILHMYGGYMHIAALLLFVPKRAYLLLAAGAIIMFHTLWLVIPYDNGWHFDTLQYTDFWTIPGFLRNTFYNGWNPVFPWLAFFLLGMWLGRLNWQQGRVRAWVLGVGAAGFVLVESIQALTRQNLFTANLTFYLTADYLPPFLPFMLGTASVALMVLVVCLEIGNRLPNSGFINAFVQTGQMTLTHYVVHLTLGMVVLGALTGQPYTGVLSQQPVASPGLVLGFAATFYGLSVAFSAIWSRYKQHGPLETLMRQVAG